VAESRSVDARLEEIFRRDFPKLVEADAEAGFVEHELLDSADVVLLLAAIEEGFGIEIPGDELREENVGSKAALRKYVESKLR
jgi:acyl carrier protein